MKITVIHGQSHKGCSYFMSQSLLQHLDADIEEFFLPKDFHHFCNGCTRCILEGEQLCPHYDDLQVIVEAMDRADVLVFTSPVYCFHTSGSMKAFLDHLGYRWMAHRPSESMFHKQTVILASAAGMGTKKTIKDIADSVQFWGVSKIYTFGQAVRAASPSAMSENVRNKIQSKTKLIAQKIIKNYDKKAVSFKTKFLFYMMRMMHKESDNKIDKNYWTKKGWLANSRPW